MAMQIAGVEAARHSTSADAEQKHVREIPPARQAAE
jgi:hypothetical protein